MECAMSTLTTVPFCGDIQRIQIDTENLDETILSIVVVTQRLHETQELMVSPHPTRIASKVIQTLQSSAVGTGTVGNVTLQMWERHKKEVRNVGFFFCIAAL
jgi:hypothetical protein